MFRMLIAPLFMFPVLVAFHTGRNASNESSIIGTSQMRVGQSMDDGSARDPQTLVYMPAEGLQSSCCPSGFMLIDKMCYFLGTNKVTWYEALTICQFVADNAYLAEIPTPDDQILLKSLIVKNTDAGEYWVGAVNFTQVEYRWYKSNALVNASLWDTNEPNNAGDFERCAEQRHNGRLNDNDCHAKRNYICTKPIPTRNANIQCKGCRQELTRSRRISGSKMAETIQSREGTRDVEPETAEVELRELTVNVRERKASKCDSCVRQSESLWYHRAAVFLCFRCEMYVCGECLSKHTFHEGLNVRSQEIEREESRREAGETDRMRKQSERQRMRKKYINKVLNESETDRTEKFNKSHTIICDRIVVKHELDENEDCSVTEMCGLDNKMLMICDDKNRCVKIFKLGSYTLQRYLRFRSRPKGVTEIRLEQNDPADQRLIAVTLPEKRQILFIDLNITPAIIQTVIETERPCVYLRFYDNKIFAVCREPDSLFSVYIKSARGMTLNSFDTGIHGYAGPRLAVVTGRVYLTDYYKSKVQCRDVEGQMISETIITESMPKGIIVDPDKNVYVCAWGHSKVYKLNSDLTQYSSVLNRTTDYIARPLALCYYRDKLFIKHFDWGPAPLTKFVTVVGLL